VQEPVLLAHESKQKLRDAIQRVNRGRWTPSCRSAPTSHAEVAAMAEFWLGSR